jgi:hypothetical protein
VRRKIWQPWWVSLPAAVFFRKKGKAIKRFQSLIAKPIFIIYSLLFSDVEIRESDEPEQGLPDFSPQKLPKCTK